MVEANPELFHEPQSLFELDKFPVQNKVVDPMALDAQLPFIAKMHGGADTAPLASPAGMTPLLQSPPDTVTLGPPKEKEIAIKEEVSEGQHTFNKVKTPTVIVQQVEG